MKVRRITAAFLTALILLNAVIVRAEGNLQRVRVGIESYKNAGEIPIGNKDILIGFESNQSFVSSAAINTAGAFSAVPASLYYVRVDAFFNDYSQAKASAEGFKANGYKACAALLDDFNFAVYLGGYQSEGEALSVKNSIQQNSSLLNPAGYRTAITENGYTIIIFDNPNKNGQIKGSTTVSIGSRRYRGAIEFCRSGSAVTLVNVLLMDEYLYSVVASEMAPGWNTEALKAQAVASRSYAATRYKAHLASNYNFCDGVHCQLYQGEGYEAESTVRAVSETSGVIAYYNNEPINAVFFSSSGGATADSETVWTDTVPYLRSVTDINEKTAKEWQRSFTLTEITSLANANGYNIGRVASVSINGVSAFGRVNKLDITGDNGVVSLEKEEIRTFFSSSKGGSLESRMFVLGDTMPEQGLVSASISKVYIQSGLGVGEYTTEGLYAFLMEGLPPVKLAGSLTAVSDNSAFIIGNEKANAKTNGAQASLGSSGADTIVFSGRGYGHGVGMSQHGANGMAEAGYTYREILSYYYTGIEIR